MRIDFLTSCASSFGEELEQDDTEHCRTSEDLNHLKETVQVLRSAVFIRSLARTDV